MVLAIVFGTNKVMAGSSKMGLYDRKNGKVKRSNLKRGNRKNKGLGAAARPPSTNNRAALACHEEPGGDPHLNCEGSEVNYTCQNWNWAGECTSWVESDVICPCGYQAIIGRFGGCTCSRPYTPNRML